MGYDTVWSKTLHTGEYVRFDRIYLCVSGTRVVVVNGVVHQ